MAKPIGNIQAFKFHLKVHWQKCSASAAAAASIVLCFCFLFLPRKHQQIIKLQPINRNEKKYAWNDARNACATIRFLLLLVLFFSVAVVTFFVCIFFSWSAQARILFTKFSTFTTIMTHSTLFRAHFYYSILMVFKWPNRTFCLITYSLQHWRSIPALAVTATVFVVGDSHLKIYWTIVLLGCLRWIKTLKKNNNNNDDAQQRAASDILRFRQFRNVEQFRIFGSLNERIFKLMHVFW